MKKIKEKRQRKDQVQPTSKPLPHTFHISHISNMYSFCSRHTVYFSGPLLNQALSIKVLLSLRSFYYLKQTAAYRDDSYDSLPLISSFYDKYTFFYPLLNQALSIKLLLSLRNFHYLKQTAAYVMTHTTHCLYFSSFYDKYSITFKTLDHSYYQALSRVINFNKGVFI